MAGHILFQTVKACGQQEGKKAHKDFQIRNSETQSYWITISKTSRTE